MNHLTGQQSQILNAYTYDAFGNMLSAREQRGNPFRYAGEMQDTLTGHYYLRARFYNPQIARFTQEDTYRGDGLNLYAYVANNPIRYVDPSGYMCEVKGDVYDQKVSGVNGVALYRKMGMEEINSTLNDKTLQTAIHGSDSDKWITTSLNKLIASSSQGGFNNYAVAKGTKEGVVEFIVSKDYYKYVQETAVPQRGSRKSRSIKYHYEGLPKKGPDINYGITPTELDKFNHPDNLLSVRLLEDTLKIK
ncbi:RHS repeat-associated core domain-containing protein [Paenibacillus tundrae]